MVNQECLKRTDQFFPPSLFLLLCPKFVTRKLGLGIFYTLPGRRTFYTLPYLVNTLRRVETKVESVKST